MELADSFGFGRSLTDGGPHLLAAIQLSTTRDGAVLSVDHFMLSEIYPPFGVPRELPSS